MPADQADSIEIMVVYAGKVIDLLSAAPGRPGSTTTGGNTAERASAIRSDGEEIRARAGIAPGPPHPPPPQAQPEEGASTVMFSAASFTQMKQQATARPAAPAARPRPRRPGALFRPRTRRPMKRPSASPAWW
jgi:hypothetical protein